MSSLSRPDGADRRRAPGARERRRAATPATGGADGLQTLHRAMAILDLFRPGAEEWTASEVSDRLGLSLATASRLLRGLESHGLLARRAGRAYRLGFGAVSLGQRALQAIEVREPLRPVVARLARRSGETALALVLDEHAEAAIAVDRAESGDDIRISVTIGSRHPVTTGLGRVLLAQLPESSYELALGRPPSTELLRELRTIREQGWLVSYESVEKGTWGASAPVVDGFGHPVAALGVIAPTSRHSPKQETELVAAVRAAADEATDKLQLR